MDRTTVVSRARFRTVRSGVAMPIGRVSTLDALVATLRRQILEGAIAPGTHLAEVDLAESHGVSRQSIRSALAELVHFGILEREPHRGVWVPALTHAQIGDLWWVRGIIEREAVRRAMARDADWSAVRVAVDAIAALTPRSSWADAVEADLGFHRAVVNAAQSPHLMRVYRLLTGELNLALAGNRNNEVPGFMAGEHARLLEAFEHGDPDAAVRLLEQHLEEGLNTGTRLRQAREPGIDRGHKEEPA